MRVLMATDAFPPNCGGSGWSTWELARGLRAQRHEVLVVQPRPGLEAGLTREYDGFTIREVACPSSAVPALRNYIKNERLTARLAPLIADLARRERIDLVHGQHVMTGPPAVLGAHAAGLPAVVTVRDYWPVCYWSDLIDRPGAPTLCEACSARHMTVCIRPRAGALWPAALPLIPYMRANLRAKQARLADADAVIAVSSTIARDLLARSVGLRTEQLHQIPNPVDVAALRETAGAAADAIDAPAGPFILYAGKLAPNKGVQYLVPALVRSGVQWPVVVAGDGPGRETLEREARAAGLRLTVTGWLPREAVLGWLARAAVLAFPSYGPESLSRVLIEASALGLPIAAMNTGGTPDIIEHERTGLLSSTADGLGDDLKRLAGDEALRRRLGTAARAHVDARFDAAGVVSRVVEVYRSAGAARQTTQAGGR